MDWNLQNLTNQRRKKAGMGYELSSFSVQEEMEEGKFSADG